MTSSIVWRPGPLEFVIDIDGAPTLQWAGLPGTRGVDAGRAALPLAEVRLAGEGNADASSERLVGGSTGRRLRYVAHAETADGETRSLTVEMQDPATRLTVRTSFTVRGDVPVATAETEVVNDGSGPVGVQFVSSLVVGGLTGHAENWWRDHHVSVAQNSWFREAVWVRRSLGDVGIDDIGLAQWGHPGSRASFGLTGRGSWSSGGHLPMGLLSGGGRSMLWQIEHNGPWRWEIGDLHGDLYLLASGPTDQAHDWSITLAPGEAFRSVPAAMAWGASDDDAFAAMTEHRRRIRRPHPDDERLPVIFNDYMNCLSGDPTSAKLAPLIDAAAAAGAEYFCIDAGWHAEDGDWWSDVGDWMPSTWRFDAGLEGELAKIRSRGMIPGLWIEPEVVGVNSAVARTLPDEAFFQRDGARIVESGRHQLDFRHPAARAHLDAVIDRFVAEYGVGYLKFDYNIDITQGTDAADDAPGAGQLGHSRAYLGWLRAVMDRHPGLVIENCASGGQRLDYALLALHPVQSTSDNQDPLLYAPIAAAAPTAVTPEQSAVWSYPQPDWSDERNAFTMVNSLLGRVHLSGRVDLLDPDQTALVIEAVNAYKGYRERLRHGRPFWPLGLPSWHDDLIALGMDCGEETYVTVWRRGGAVDVEIPLPSFAGVDLEAVPIYPTTLPTDVSWRPESGVLALGLPDEPAARLLRLGRGRA